MKCAWASCPANAVAFEDGHPMCQPHIRVHRIFEAEDGKSRPCGRCGQPLIHKTKIICNRCRAAR